jgi:hypothetical protein
MVVPMLHSCVRRRSSSMLMPSRRRTPRMLRRHRRWKTSTPRVRLFESVRHFFGLSDKTTDELKPSLACPASVL